MLGDAELIQAAFSGKWAPLVPVCGARCASQKRRSNDVSAFAMSTARHAEPLQLEPSITSM